MVVNTASPGSSTGLGIGLGIGLGVRLVVALLTAVLLLAGAVGVVGAASAGAAWTGNATRGSGQLTAAVLKARLDPRSSAAPTAIPAPGTESIAKPSLLGLASSTMIDLVNASSIPVPINVTVTSTQAVGVVSTLQSCAVAWTAAGVCTPGAQTVATASGGILNSTQATWTVPISTVGARYYLKLSVPASVIGAVTVTAKTVPSPSDRSAG